MLLKFQSALWFDPACRCTFLDVLGALAREAHVVRRDLQLQPLLGVAGRGGINAAGCRINDETNATKPILKPTMKRKHNENH